MKTKIREAMTRLLQSKSYINTLLKEGKSLDEINKKREKLGLSPLEFSVKK